jgi:hypothetical protein
MGCSASLPDINFYHKANITKTEILKGFMDNLEEESKILDPLDKYSEKIPELNELRSKLVQVLDAQPNNLRKNKYMIKKYVRYLEVSGGPEENKAKFQITELTKLYK